MSDWAALRAAALRRDGDECTLHFRRLCFGPLDPHHVWRRGQGGPDDIDNLITLCRLHHRWVHEHPLLGQSMGLLVPAWTGYTGLLVTPILRQAVRDGRPLFAPWLTDAERDETVRQDARWTGATQPRWSP